MHRMIILLSGIFAASSNPPYAELDEALVDDSSIVPETPDSLLPTGSACPIGTLPMEGEEIIEDQNDVTENDVTEDGEIVGEGTIISLGSLGGDFRRLLQHINEANTMGTSLGNQLARLVQEIAEMKNAAGQCRARLETASDSPAAKETARQQLNEIFVAIDRLETLVQVLALHSTATGN